MLDIMIVEDEAPIQRSVRSAVESAVDKVNAVATAFNGQEALQLLQTFQPHVIITDIRMPVMDGIALMERVRQLFPHIELVVFSGYQEFEYAKKAMEHGVRHYLLKPVSRAQIVKLLETLHKEALGRCAEQYRQHTASLICGTVPPGLDLLSEIYDSHLLLLCCAGAFPDYCLDEDIPGKAYWERNNLNSIMEDELGDAGEFAVINGRSVSEQLVVISFRRGRTNGRSPLEWGRRIAGRLGRELNVTIVCSELFARLEDAPSAAHLCRSVLCKQVKFGLTDCITVSENQEAGANDPKFDPSIENMISVALEQRDGKKIQLQLQALLEEWRLKQARQLYVERIIKRMLRTLLKESAGRDAGFIDNLEIETNRLLLQSSDYGELYGYLCQLVESIIDGSAAGREEREKSGALIADRIERYLTAHYTENINHQVLAKKFGFVPSYLSRVFTKYKGTSPAKYMVRLRIEAARELLQDPVWLTKDIAEIVGYNDPSYFSRLFKRETGVYPSEYRERLGINGS